MNLLKLAQTIMQWLGYDEATGTMSIDADNLAVKDPVIEVNTSGAAGDAGIRVMRTVGDNAELLHRPGVGWVHKEGASEIVLGAAGPTQSGTDPNFSQRVDTQLWLGL